MGGFRRLAFCFFITQMQKQNKTPHFLLYFSSGPAPFSLSPPRPVTRLPPGWLSACRFDASATGPFQTPRKRRRGRGMRLWAEPAVPPIAPPIPLLDNTPHPTFFEEGIKERKRPLVLSASDCKPIRCRNLLLPRTRPVV